MCENMKTVICKIVGHKWGKFTYSWTFKWMWRICGRCFKSETIDYDEWYKKQEEIPFTKIENPV